jgi:hypothetical protein
MLGRVVNVDGEVGIVVKNPAEGKALVQIFDGSATVRTVERSAAELRTWEGKSIVAPPALAPAPADEPPTPGPEVKKHK